MSTTRTTRRQALGAAGLLSSTIRRSARTRRTTSRLAPLRTAADAGMSVLERSGVEAWTAEAIAAASNQSAVLVLGRTGQAEPGGAATVRLRIRLHDRDHDCAPWVGARVAISPAEIGRPDRPGEHTNARPDEHGQSCWATTGEDGSVLLEAPAPGFKRELRLRLEIFSAEDRTTASRWSSSLVLVPADMAIARPGASGETVMARLRADGDGGHEGSLELALASEETQLDPPTPAALVPWQLLGAHVERRRGGRRMLLVTVKARQRTPVTIRLAGAGGLAVRRPVTLAVGTHTLSATIPPATRPGTARLALAVGTPGAVEHRHLRLRMPA